MNGVPSHDAAPGIGLAENAADAFKFMYACPVGVAEIAADGTFGHVNPMAMGLLMPVANGRWQNNLFAMLQPFAPELPGLVAAHGDAGGTVCDGHRIAITPRLVLACTLVRLGAGRLMAAITDVSAQVAQEAQLRQAEAGLRHAEAMLAAAQERQRAERELKIQAERFATALNAMSQALCMFDASGRIGVVNDRFAELFSVPWAALAAGSTIEAMMAAGAATSRLTPDDAAAISLSIVDMKSASGPASWTVELTDGRTLAISHAPMADHGCVVTLEDVSERKLAEAKISHMAHHDALTGLPNRITFRSRLAEAVARSLRQEPAAVLCLDLDHFKTVNDTLGHPAGDNLLRQVSDRLRNNVRSVDTVARLGGDEFAIIQSGYDQPADATSLSQRLIDVLGEAFDIDGHDVVIGTTIGIALLPSDGTDPDQILKNADMALYSAKAAGRGIYRFFEPEMDVMMQARRTMENDLRHALRTGGMQVYYQPLMCVSENKVLGFEALVRWRHPERGMISPADFIPLAEEIGLIVPLGRWILQQACADAATWETDIKVAVNVSAAQFASATLVQDVASALETSGLAPSRLELEVTETVMLHDTDAVLRIMHQLRDMGVTIAMDDFGTGYSSLNYLRRFPFSKVKIDRSFIESLGEGEASETIVVAIVELCKALGMVTLAEGVETEGQLDRLRRGKCDQVQGFLFSEAQPAANVAEICRVSNLTAR